MSLLAQLDACKKDFSDDEIKGIKDNAKEILHSITVNDSCKCEILCILTNKYIKTSNNLYIETIDSLLQNSGDINFLEYFILVGQQLYTKNFTPWFRYIYNNRDKKNLEMSLLFTQSISYITVEGTPQEKKVTKKIDREAKKNKYTNEELKYLKELRAKIYQHN